MKIVLQRLLEVLIDLNDLLVQREREREKPFTSNDF